MFPLHRWFSIGIVSLAAGLATPCVHAQTPVLIHAFDASTEVTDNNGQPWQNWFGTAFYQVLWDASDASDNPASGSLRVETYYPDSGIGGCCGPQFLVMNAYDGINPPLAGNGNSMNVPVATNVSFDVRFDPITDLNGSANWPTIEVGTRGSSFNQYTFGTFTIPGTETNWVRVNIPITASANWTNIPHVFFKHFSGSRTNWLVFYVDNIEFTMADVEIAPPQMTLQKSAPALRLFSGPSQYNRTQIGTVDTNQSWVGGNFPVTYSFTVSSYDVTVPLNEFHVFFLPLNAINGGTVDQFSDYSTASNNFRIQITGLNAGSPQVQYQLDWKTNLVNSNPNNVLLTRTNQTGVGVWTLTFNSDTSGTITAPGGIAEPFTLPAEAASQFANPLVMLLGVQPNPTTAIGQYLDLSAVQTANIAAPGVPVNSSFTSGAPIDTNIWRTASVSQDAANIVEVGSDQPWWLYWGYPDTGFELSAKAALEDGAVPFKSPAYFTGYDTNIPVVRRTLGARVSTLLPQASMPTLNGLSNGVPGSAAFFRLQKPGPVE